MKTKISLFTLLLTFIMVVPSCKDDGEDATNENPVVNLISPRGEVDIEQDIKVEINFVDNNGLRDVEVRLGNQNLTAGGGIYSLSQRGLSGISDKLEFTFEPPLGLDIIGDNYIYIKCTDVDGNVTIIDEDFTIVDLAGPEITITNYDPQYVVQGSIFDLFVNFTYQDNTNVEYVAVELWQTDANQNLTTRWAIEEESLNPPRATGSKSEAIMPSFGWPMAGTKFALVVKARDTDGNVSEEMIFDEVGF